MTEDVSTVAELIMAKGGPAVFARKLREKEGGKLPYSQMTRSWKSRGKIPPAWWPPIVRTFRDVSMRQLEALHPNIRNPEDQDG